MKAITVEPHKPGTARLEDVPEPDVRDGSVLVEAIAVGVCGTDVEIVEGKYGWAPPGKTRLVLGHESLGRVLDPGPSSALRKGDLVVGIVRRPDPGPLPQLRGRRVGHVPQRPVHRARHQADRRLHVRALAHRARVRDEGRPVARPARRAARADDRGRQGVGAGARRRPARVLGAAHRARHRRRARSACSRPWSASSTGSTSTSSTASSRGPSPSSCARSARPITRGSGADIGFEPDVIVECTGVGQVIADSIQAVGAGGIVCLTGVGSGGRTTGSPTADVAATMVLQNNVIVGSVNANKRHWYKAGQVLARADRAWLARLITRREPPEDVRARARSGSRTTSRSSSSSPRSEEIGPWRGPQSCQAYVSPTSPNRSG